MLCVSVPFYECIGCTCPSLIDRCSEIPDRAYGPIVGTWRLVLPAVLTTSLVVYYYERLSLDSLKKKTSHIPFKKTVCRDFLTD
jgi:hypothetical protein